MQISVAFGFEAESMEEAQEIVATWKVSPGVVIFGMSGTVHGIAQPVEVTTGGTIGGTLLVKGQRSPAEDFPPMPPSGIPA